MIEKVASFDIVVNLFASTGAAEDKGYNASASGIAVVVIVVIVVIVMILASIFAVVIVCLLCKCCTKRRGQSDIPSESPNFAHDEISLDRKSSAIAELPRDASCQLQSCQLPRNSAEYDTIQDDILNCARKLT